MRQHTKQKKRFVILTVSQSKLCVAEQKSDAEIAAAFASLEKEKEAALQSLESEVKKHSDRTPSDLLDG